MRVPLSWLRELVDVDLAVDDLVDVMSLGGLEVEEVHRPGAGTTGVRSARVVSHAPHPQADTLQVVHVTDGTTETELVCGAWNLAADDVVAHAAPGATLPGGTTLERREIRGVVSNGMLCSARELGIGDDHEGIIVLPPGTDLGMDVTDLLPIGEPVIEVAVMADRGDHHSILGVARDLAALLDATYRVPDVPEPAGEGPVPIEIVAADGCSHFVTWALDDVHVGSSPWWLRQRLHQCGIRSINAVVDVTNYVMLELGQPLHAFDLDALAGPQLTVRWAAAGERLTTLDHVERELEAGDLLIADADGPVSLAGVMGGASTEVGEGTTRVLIEGAVWDPATIRRTSRRLDLVSEASLRFERRVDPAGAQRAVARAAALLAQLAGARPAGANHAGEPARDRTPVVYDPVWAAEFLGVGELDADRQARLLERAGCRVDREDGALVVVAPSWRGDLTRPADLAEEVVRLHGYEHVPSTLPAIAQAGGLTRTQHAERTIREVVRAAGFHESLSRPFVGAGALTGTVPSDGRVELANPLAATAALLRPSLLDGLLATVRRNVGQGRPGTAVFEYGRIFRPAGDALDDALKAFGDGWRWQDRRGGDLPTQPRTLGLAAQGLRVGERWLDPDSTWSVFDLLAVLDEVVARLAPTAGTDDDVPWRLERETVERPGLHPGRCAVLRLEGTELGLVGQLHPHEVEQRDLVEPVVVAELLIEPLLAHLAVPQDPVRAVRLARHPAVTVDVALQAAEDVPYATLEAAVRRGAGDLLDELWWFDEYRGAQVGEGRRSIAIRLRLQAPDRQLSDGDADAVIESVAAEAGRIGATLRR